MNLEKAKEYLHDCLIKIKTITSKRTVEIYEDLEILEDPIRLNYNDYSDAESYYTEAVEPLIAEFYKALKVYEIFEDNIPQRCKLLEWAAFELKEVDTTLSNFDNHLPYKLDYASLQEIFEVKAKVFDEYRQRGLKICLSLIEELKLTEEQPKRSRAKTCKVKWLGEQVHLVELIWALKDKGWIDLPSTKTEHARAILDAFDISLTKQNLNSNELASFTKTLSGFNEKHIGFCYPGHQYYNELNNYKPFFSELHSNKKL